MTVLKDLLARIDPPELREQIESALWSGDQDRLRELAECGCCCDEHFSASCPAQVWDGCRASGSPYRMRIPDEDFDRVSRELQEPPRISPALQGLARRYLTEDD